jgi:hypothetical protein
MKGQTNAKRATLSYMQMEEMLAGTETAFWARTHRTMHDPGLFLNNAQNTEVAQREVTLWRRRVGTEEAVVM